MLAASALLELQSFRILSHQQDSEPRSALAVKRAGAWHVWLEKQAMQRLEESRQGRDINSCIIEKLN
jgi:hypothetical protein